MQSRVTTSFSCTDITGWSWVTFWAILDPTGKKSKIRSLRISTVEQRNSILHSTAPSSQGAHNHLFPQSLGPRGVRSHWGHPYLATMKPWPPSEGWREACLRSSSRWKVSSSISRLCKVRWAWQGEGRIAELCVAAAPQQETAVSWRSKLMWVMSASLWTRWDSHSTQTSFCINQHFNW